MTQTVVRDPALDEPQGRAERRDERDLLFGRPWEDRSFEAVEAGVGFAAGLAIGTAVAGPIGAVVGSLVGLTGGFAAGEALERAVGRAATTTDAGDHEPPETP
jgi:hypothetical protein